MVMVMGFVITACGGDSDAGTTTTSAAATTSSTALPATTTTTAVPTTTTTAVLTPLEELGYPVSDDWVVETVVSGIDSATGGLAVGPDGVMYLGDFGYADHLGDRVYRIQPDGTVEVFAQSDLMTSLTMTTFGPDGTLYQSSYGSDRLFRISADGEVELITDEIDGPTGIVVLADGTLFVESYPRNTLYRVSTDGTVEEVVFDRRFNGLNGLTIDENGVLYAIDHKDGGIFSITQDGVAEKIFQFPEETSHGVYHDGSLFVTSRGGYVVFRYDIATGDVEIIAGNGQPGDQDGRGGEASFGRPNAITVGPDGALYINHGDGHDNDPVTIRRISFQP